MAARTLFVSIVVMGVSLGASRGRADVTNAADMSGQPNSQSQGINPAGGPEVPRLRLPTPRPPRDLVRRPVAVVDLSNDEAVREVANQILAALKDHTELAAPEVSDGAALVDKPPPDEEQRIGNAQSKLLSAERNLAQRNFREAAIAAREGQDQLLNVTPRAALALYVDLAIAQGQSRLGEKNQAEAREAFALAYRLDPRRTLDESHYLPEVVQAFEAAKRVSGGGSSITVRGAGEVWIDGQTVGSAPGSFKISFGRHVVWLAGVLREPIGKEVIITEARPGDVTILDGPLTRPQKVVRLRKALSQAQDPAARATAMTQLAGFIHVHDAVLLSTVDGKIIYQTWRDSEPGFSALRELVRDRPTDVLKQLAPPPPPDEPPPPVIVGLPPAPPRWYEQRSVQLGVAAAIVAIVIGGYMWSHYTEPPRPWDPNITGFGAPGQQ